MKAVKPMFSLEHEAVARMYVQERIAQAAREHLLDEAKRARRARHAKVALMARVGRTLVIVGQRLEATGATERYSPT